MGTRKFRTPGSAQHSALEAAKGLMAERLKYEQWLDDLEAKKDATPPKVYERVQKDYLDRLHNVVEQLGKYTETLEQHAETLTGKLRDLQAMEEAIQEEQAEAALRKQVGEITAAEWESSSRKAQKELSKINENQESIETDLAQIRGLLGEEDEEEEEEDEAPAKGSKDFNELEFLSSVVGQTTAPQPAANRSSGPSTPPKTPTPTAAAAPAPAAAQPRATPAASAPPAAAPRVSNPPPRPTPSQAAPAAPARTSNPSAPASAAPTPASTPAQSAPAAATAPAPAPPAPAAPPAAADPGAEPPSAHRPTVATEQTKTLKCTECGTMNYATEWYCERCGAELTGA